MFFRRAASLVCLSCAVIAAACARSIQTSSGQNPPRHMLTIPEFQAFPSAPADARFTYGDATSQFGELRVPSGSGPHPVAVLIHGGCWREPYSVSRELGPLGDSLKAHGIATWNIEYRRLYEPGSGWPGTYLDVGHAIDYLRKIAGEHKLDLNRVVVVGHSAGGHLAMWAAARGRLPANSGVYIANPLPIRGVINLAGTMDMRDNIQNMQTACRDTVVTGMLGGASSQFPQRYDQVSAISLVPLGVLQTLIWDDHEEFVPLALAQKYVDAATRAGDPAKIIIVPNTGHFDLASPYTPAWPVLLNAIKTMLDGKMPQ